ncbi:unnamed protein product, partial [marine sediment metagenome]
MAGRYIKDGVASGRLRSASEGKMPMFGKRISSGAATAPSTPARAANPPQQQGPANQPAPAQQSVVPQQLPTAKPKVSKDKIDQFNALKMRLHRKLIDQLDLSHLVGEEDALREQVKEIVSQLADQENTLLNFGERQRLINEVLDETFGLGPLEVLLADPTINDILVNGPKQVYVERRGN